MLRHPLIYMYMGAGRWVTAWGYLAKSTNRLSHYPHKTKHKRLVACIDLIIINLDRTLYGSFALKH